MPGGMITVDARNTYAAAIFMGAVQKTIFGTDQPDIAKDGQPKWAVDVAVTYLAEPGRKTVSEVISVSVLGADPSASIPAGSPVEFDGLKVYGHPDAVSPGVEDFPSPAVLEFKTFDSENLAYRRQVVKKAYFQAGCYARMMQEYDGEAYDAFVVFLDFVKKTPLTDAEILAGKGMRNGLIESVLSDMDKEKKAMLNDPIIVFKLTPDEVDHGYNYCRWCAREAYAKMNLENQ